MRTLNALAGLTAAATLGVCEPLYAEGPKTVVNPAHLPDTTRYGYSQAAIASPDTRVVYVAGQVGVSDEGPNDFESQVDRAFENLIAALEASGSSADRVVKTTLLVKDMSDEKLAYLVKKRRDIFRDSPPASTLIPVPALALDSMLFEIDAIAVSSN